jgi:dUTP pyrophosphatase
MSIGGTMKIEIKAIHPKLGKEWKLPTYATPGSVGMDLVAAIDEPLTINVGCRALVPAGFSMSLPPGYEAQIRPRSGLAIKHGITVLNSPGTIDFDYTQQIGVILLNTDLNTSFTVKPGDRIAQMIISKVELVEWAVVADLRLTQRTGGFGSSGV